VSKNGIDDLIHKLTGDKIKLGPVNISTDKPEVSVGGSAGIQGAF
jgi:hypothetical protein